MDEKTVIKLRLDEVENKIMFVMKKLNILQTNIESLQAAISNGTENTDTTPSDGNA